MFAYDLLNEPGAVGKPEDGWYMGRMGDVEFRQRISLSPGERNGDDVFREWTKLMVTAIRKRDKNHLITMGMLPFPSAYKAAAAELDFNLSALVSEEWTRRSPCSRSSIGVNQS